MKILVFDAKLSSSAFVRGFANKFTYHLFQNQEGTEKLQGADRFYNYNWPTWDGIIPDNSEVVFQGLVRGTKEVYDACIEQERDYYYFDQPYFFYSDYKQNSAGDKWYRIIKNNTQKTFIDKTGRCKTRFERIKERVKDRPELIDQITLKPYQYDGKHILVIPPSYHTAQWYGIDRLQWQYHITDQLKKYTKREIRVRQKFKNDVDWSPDRVEKPLHEDLIDCHAMVSFHSMCAVHAVVAGIPSFASEHSPAWPVSLSLKELDQIEDPLYSGEREQWLHSLLGSQFTEAEMLAGNAYHFVNGKSV